MHVLGAEIRCYFTERLICATYPFLNFLVNYGSFQLTIYCLEQSIQVKFNEHRNFEEKHKYFSIRRLNKTTQTKIYVNRHISATRDVIN